MLDALKSDAPSVPTAEATCRPHLASPSQNVAYVCARSQSAPAALPGPTPGPSATSSLSQFCLRLPKAELHAHLNGMLRDATLRELAEIHGISPDSCKLSARGGRTLNECFTVFAVIHRVTQSLEVVRRIAREAVEDAAGDGVVYLEIRTTPKAYPGTNISKSSYVHAVLMGIEDSAQEGGSWCQTKLLLSIDRRESPKQAIETVELAASMQHRGVVGVDLSGNPSLGKFADWEPALQAARSRGLKVTIHTGEIYSDGEPAEILAFKPDRLGHVCFLSDAHHQALLDSRSPLELCLTSNLVSESVPTLASHHFQQYYSAGQNAVVLCTDDPGVFNTTLSREYMIAAEAFGLSHHALVQLAKNGLDAAFASKETMHVVRREFERRVALLEHGDRSGEPTA